ncbi:unnamed protein product [Soboliphyme baturini]|uniref:UBX domain-containing protein n=1 Tax=Soboliphyme baturini TaxID=241478 RepID=A0A183IJA0_9BILA|nr:unnamed protein product [Soboliphyme baturini]
MSAEYPQNGELVRRNADCLVLRFRTVVEHVGEATGVTQRPPHTRHGSACRSCCMCFSCCSNEMWLSSQRCVLRIIPGYPPKVRLRVTARSGQRYAYASLNSLDRFVSQMRKPNLFKNSTYILMLKYEALKSAGIRNAKPLAILLHV